MYLGSSFQIVVQSRSIVRCLRTVFVRCTNCISLVPPLCLLLFGGASVLWIRLLHTLFESGIGTNTSATMSGSKVWTNSAGKASGRIATAGCGATYMIRIVYAHVDLRTNIRYLKKKT